MSPSVVAARPVMLTADVEVKRTTAAVAHPVGDQSLTLAMIEPAIGFVKARLAELAVTFRLLRNASEPSPGTDFGAVKSAAVKSARPAAVLSEIAEATCVCDTAALPVSSAC